MIENKGTEEENLKNKTGENKKTHWNRKNEEKDGIKGKNYSSFPNISGLVPNCLSSLGWIMSSAYLDFFFLSESKVARKKQKVKISAGDSGYWNKINNMETYVPGSYTNWMKILQGSRPTLSYWLTTLK